MAATASITPRGLSIGLWVLAAALAAAGGFFTAGAVRTRPTEGPLASADLTSVAQAAPAAREASLEVYQALAEAAVFGAAAPSPAAAPVATDVTMTASVVGTIVHGELSRAIVDVGAGGQKLVRVGDALEGGHVTKITSSEVILERDGREISMPVRAHNRPRTAPAVVAVAPPVAPPRVIGLTPAEPAEQPRTEGSLETGDIELKDFDTFYNDLKQGLLAAKVKPVLDAAGKPLGIAFDAVPEGKVLWRMGMRPGDIVTEVNTIPAADMNSLLNTFDKVAAQVRSGDESFIVIDRVRDQKPDAVILTIW